MKKETRITLIAIITILMLLVIGGTIYGYVQKYAYAEYNDTEPDSILSFNQQVLNSRINSSGGSEQRIIFSDNIVPTHRYYFRVSVGSIDTMQGNQFFFTNDPNTLSVVQTIWLVNHLGEYDTLMIPSPNNTYLMTVCNVSMSWNNLMCIDLTQMFGAGNEPSYAQCRELFRAEYYNYTTFTPISLNGFEAYNQALEDIFNNYYYYLDISALGNSTYKVDYDGQPSLYTYQYRDGAYTWQWKNTIGVPLYAKLQPNSSVTIDYVLLKFLDPGNYLQVMAKDNNNNFVSLAIGTDQLDSGTTTTHELSFTLPFEINTLYFNVGKWVNGNFVVTTDSSQTSPTIMAFQLDIKANQLDLTSAIISAKDSGYELARDYYENKYSQGGSGYESIFNAGKQYAITHNTNNAWGSAWDFIESAFTGIGSLFTIQLLPGVPLSVFILVPLMLSLIFFIVKLVKGGG